MNKCLWRLTFPQTGRSQVWTWWKLVLLSIIYSIYEKIKLHRLFQTEWEASIVKLLKLRKGMLICGVWTRTFQAIFVQMTSCRQNWPQTSLIIITKPITQASPQLQRILIRISLFDIKIKFINQSISSHAQASSQQNLQLNSNACSSRLSSTLHWNLD